MTSTNYILIPRYGRNVQVRRDLHTEFHYHWSIADTEVTLIALQAFSLFRKLCWKQRTEQSHIFSYKTIIYSRETGAELRSSLCSFSFVENTLTFGLDMQMNKFEAQKRRLLVTSVTLAPCFLKIHLNVRRPHRSSKRSSHFPTRWMYAFTASPIHNTDLANPILLILFTLMCLATNQIVFSFM